MAYRASEKGFMALVATTLTPNDALTLRHEPSEVTSNEMHVHKNSAHLGQLGAGDKASILTAVLTKSEIYFIPLQCSG